MLAPQQQKIHPVATGAMQRGTGGMHQPAKRPTLAKPGGSAPAPGTRGPLSWQQLLQQYLERVQGGR